MFRPRNGSSLPNMWPKIENLQFKFVKIKKSDYYFGAKFYGKSNSESPVARKQCVWTQLKWYYGEKNFLSAVPIEKPEVNFFNLFIICMVIHQ